MRHVFFMVRSSSNRSKYALGFGLAPQGFQGYSMDYIKKGIFENKILLHYLARIVSVFDKKG